MMKATIKDGMITLSIRLRLNVEDLSPDRPHLVASALEEAYQMGKMDGAEQLSSAVNSTLNNMRCGRE